MTQIVDRRNHGKNKSAVNRSRFIRRVKRQVKEAVARAVSKRSVTDMDRGDKVSISGRDISEPQFRLGSGGKRGAVHPGNKHFSSGDRVSRPLGGGAGAGGSRPSNSGRGEDDFVFELSREEFLEFFFDELRLPNLVKTQLAAAVDHNRIRAGHSSSGSPMDLNIVRSFRGALGRKISFRSGYAAALQALEEELLAAEESGEDGERIEALREEIATLRQRLATIPFLDTHDLRYNSRIKVVKPSFLAVMFCLMDVSGSMDQAKKDLAKRFFMLLYLFLARSYEKIQVVFIRHHTTALEVDEEQFFYARETGGTVVSSALTLMRDIIRERYPTSDWNIYAAQASDGENWEADCSLCEELLAREIMPLLQYYAYVEITEDEEQSLWQSYERVAQAYPNFAMRRIAGAEDIFPVFGDLFRKEVA